MQEQMFKLGTDPKTGKTMYYAPVPQGADIVAIAAQTQSIFSCVQCVCVPADRTIWCVSSSAEEARNASWYACGVATGAMFAKQYKI